MLLLELLSLYLLGVLYCERLLDLKHCFTAQHPHPGYNGSDFCQGLLTRQLNLKQLPAVPSTRFQQL